MKSASLWRGHAAKARQRSTISDAIEPTTGGTSREPDDSETHYIYSGILLRSLRRGGVNHAARRYAKSHAYLCRRARFRLFLLLIDPEEALSVKHNATRGGTIVDLFSIESFRV